MKNTSAAFLLQLLLLCCSSGYAQKYFRPGKIVTLKGDTINGKIDDRNLTPWVLWDARWKFFKNLPHANPDSIAFIREGNTKIEMFPPAKISAAIIEASNYFISAKVKVDMFYSTRADPFQTYERADKTIVRNLFLRVLLIGKLSLFVYVDENGKEHFYTNTGTEDYRELIYKKVPAKAGAERNVSEDTRYKEQLKALMADCSELHKKIDFLDYTEKDLMKLFNRYNNCMHTEPVYVSKTDGRRASFHLFAGVDIADFSFTGMDYFSHLENSTFAPCSTFLPGVRMVVPLQRNRKKFSFVLDLANRNISLSSYHLYSTSTYDVQLYMDYLKLNTGFRYKLRTPSVEPYFIGGLAGNYMVDFTSSKVQTDTDEFGQTDTIHDVAIEEPNPFDFGFFAGVGFHYKRFNLEGRFEKTTGFSPSFDLDSHVTTINVFLSFRLSREE
jgi:hypothetical protein